MGWNLNYKIKSKVHLADLIFSLLAVSPIMLILGNIMPSIFGFKIHWIYFGAIYLLLIFVNLKRTSIILIEVGFSIFVFCFFWKSFNIKSFIEFSYPFLLLITFTRSSILDRIGSSEKHLLLFKKSLLVPVVISSLQYFNIVPLKIFKAQYVNIGYTISGEQILRVNGYLYHGIELVLIISILFTFVLIKRKSFLYYLLGLLTFVSTSIKASFVIPFIYIFKLKSKYFYSILIIVSLAFFILLAFLLNEDYWDNIRLSLGYFIPEYLTGRGRIWNNYILGVSHFPIMNYLFGYGVGSSNEVFKLGQIIQNDSILPLGAHPHNQFLFMFIEIGIIGVVLYIIFLMKIFKKMEALLKHKGFWFIVSYFCSIFLIIGIFHPIGEMMIFWVGLVFIFLQLKYNNSI